MTAEELEALVDGLAPVLVTIIRRELATPLQRLAALEAQPPARDGRDGLPGPPGAPGTHGQDGRDGAPGHDGAVGLGFGDLALEHDGERMITIKAIRGELVTTLGVLTFPIPIYRGVWTDGRPYSAGDRVTWGGSEWHCQTATASRPGDGSRAWTLAVKRGRDGKDGTRG